MGIGLIIVHLLFPIIAGLHTYGVDYGYRGLDAEVARYNAFGTGIGAAFLSIALAGWRIATGT